MPASAALFLIVSFVSFFACIFGIYYLRTRQNMAMIEKGMNPKQFLNRPAPYKNLKWALLLIGAGVGLFLAYLLDNYVLTYQSYNRFGNDGRNAPIYFALIAIGGGLGLFGSYVMEKRWWDENKTKEQA
jgi:amino acid transporter